MNKELKYNYIIPKDCVIMEKHDYDMLMDRFYNLKLLNNNYENTLFDYKHILNKAIEYIEKDMKDVDDECSWVEMPTESYINQCNELLDILTGGKDE